MHNAILLSPYHKIFYNEWQLDRQSSKYNIVFDQTIEYTLEIPKLSNALKRFISDYLILNSHITNIDGTPYWVPNKEIRALEIFEGLATYEQIYKYVSQAFDVENGPLYRFAIFKQEDGNYRFILVWHHLIMSDTAGEESVELISKYYNDASYKNQFTLNDQYHLLTTTTSKLNEQVRINFEQCRCFWDDLLNDLEAIDLSFLKPFSKKQVGDSNCNPIKELRFNFIYDDVQRILHITRKYRITPYMYSQCIFTLLIHKYTSQSMFGFCYPVAITEHLGLSYGVAVNTNIQPNNVSDNNSIQDLITQNKKIIKRIRNKKHNYEYFPINSITSKISRNLIDINFVKTYLKDKIFIFNDSKTLLINREFNIDLAAKLLFEQELLKRQLNFRVRYNINQIDETILKQFVKHYQKLFFDVLSDLEHEHINKSVSDYSILTPEEYHKIVYEWNKTYKSYPANKTIHQMFEEQVLKTPNNIALVYEDTKLTYNELNCKANQLAHYIKENYSIQPDNLIALCLERNEYMLVTILAVLKTGGAYVPIAPSYPYEKVNFIINDTKSKVLITFRKYHANLIEKFTSTLKYDKIMAVDDIEIQNNLTRKPKTNLKTNVQSTNLAYVIYTSGTTGKPKGVMIEHKNVVNVVFHMLNIDNFKRMMRVSLFTSYVFDVFIFEVFNALFSGKELHVLSDNVRLDTVLLSNYLINSQINLVYIPPAILANLDKEEYDHLNSIIYAGESCDKNTGLYWSAIKNLYNYYGPTETTIFCIGKKVINGDTDLIGKPISNTTAYILDCNQNILPIGAIGELYIGGIGLARSYINNLELTSDKFIDNPFQSIEEKKLGKNGRLYKTSDLCRYLPDGNIEYIGRNDDQVKIRGYRIELSEIENALNMCTGIKQSVVLVIKHPGDLNNKYLVAYYVSYKTLHDDSIISQLSQWLPEYMIPNVFVRISKLPLTINGKIDKKALPPTYVTTDKYIEPKSSLEQIICKEFANTLSILSEKIGIKHDFFKLGGNSILAIRLVAKLKQQDLDIDVDDIFKLRTAGKIAEMVRHSKGNLALQLNSVKLLYDKFANLESAGIDSIKHKIKNYKDMIKHLEFYPLKKQIKNVLLTGATGYLGCNTLYQLLNATEYSVYLLVRAQTNQDAYNRIKSKFSSYFEQNIDEYIDRVHVLASDIEKENLHIDNESYNQLINNIDSIIHVAALVRHYGDSNIFHLMNVKATTNLLELSRKTKQKDFHYISTVSVLTDGYIPDCDYECSTENDDGSKLARGNNLYCQTKYEGEQIAINYRQGGVTSNIYRIGNLAFHSQSHKVQENIDDNAFFIRVKTMLNLGIMPKELSVTEISPVDCTASAIIKLFDQKNLSNNIYHVFNPHKANLYTLLNEHKDTHILEVPFEEFVDTILKHLELNEENEQIELFMLHQGWLKDIDLDKVTKFDILQDKTSAILEKLDFKWQPITSDMFSDIIEKTFKRKSEMTEHEIMTKHLNFITKVVPSAVYWLDHNYRFLGINQVAVEANGAQSAEHFIGKKIQEVYPHYISEQFVSDFNEVVSTQDEIQREYIIEDLTTGKPKYFMANVAPLHNLSGTENLGIIVSAIDITEKKLEERLSEKQQVFNYLTSIAETVPCLFYWMDLDGRYAGINYMCINAVGAPSKEYIIGKTIYELYQDKEIADTLQHSFDKVITTGEIQQCEDKIIDVSTRKIRYYMATRVPLRNSSGEIVGVVGTSIEITAEKEAEMLSEQQSMFNHLDNISEKIPCAVYWLDLNMTLAGANKRLLQAIGASSMDKIIGKTAYDVYPKHIADNLQQDFKKALRFGQDIENEHVIEDITTGKIRYFAATVSPLKDSSERIIGIIGTSIEITAEKEAERLDEENQAHMIRAQQDEKFRELIDKAVHDIRAPVTSTLAIAKTATGLPEDLRITLRNAANRVNDIANNLLNRYKPDTSGITIEDKKVPLLLSGAIKEILSEKRAQYHHLAVTFEEDVNENSNFAFIEIEIEAFKRTLSNLINNSVDALGGKSGIVTAGLNCESNKVNLIIKDNGQGIKPEVLDKIRNNIKITDGKKDGHGIGLSQVRETLQKNDGSILINSTPGNGTEVILTFPRIKTPSWIATEISLNSDDIIVILDDDASIHGAWDARFAQDAAQFKIKHFDLGEQAIKFINSLTPAERERVFLLTDYELLQQGLHGLDVVEQTKVKRSILVTSHHEDSEIHKQAHK
ncbi:MAG: amino acid adenylation domain-containing protein, partial [Neisseriaceae bacterium]